jgi:hypothetical protein
MERLLPQHISEGPLKGMTHSKRVNKDNLIKGPFKGKG